MPDIKYNGSDRRKDMRKRMEWECNHGEFGRKLNEVRDDYYPFKEEQIARNEACDLQIAQNTKNLDNHVTMHNHCKAKTLPKMKSSINRIIGASSFIGLILVFLVGWIKITDAKVEKIKDSQNSISSTMHEMKTDIKYMQRDISKLQAGQALQMELMRKIWQAQKGDNNEKND